MSDNKLLAENTIRRFMKLANVETLTDNFVSEMYGSKAPGAAHDAKRKPAKKQDLEEETEETIEEEVEEINEDEEFDLEEAIEDLEEQDDDVDMADAGADMEMDMGEVDPEPEMGEADMSLTEEEARLLIDLGERLKAAMDEDASAGMEDEDDEDLDDEEDDPAMMEPGMMDPGGADPVYENKDELVQEVLKRVTRRLIAKKLNNTN